MKKNTPNFTSLTLQTLLLVVSLCGLAAAIDVSDADIDSSGKVDFNDFAVMGQFWLETSSAGSDSDPWVDVRDYASLSDAIDAIGADKKTLLIPDQQNLSSNKTVPSNITLKFLRGGYLTPRSGVSITINGPFEAGLHQIFDSDEIVIFGSGSVKQIYPQWWGAVGDGVVDCTSAIQAAIDAASDGTVVFLTDGTYNLTSLIVLASNLTVKGNGKDKTILKDARPTSGHLVRGESISYVILEDLYVKGCGTEFVNDGQNKTGVLFKYSDHCTVRRCRISNFERAVIFYHSSTFGRISECEMHDCFYDGLGSYTHQTRENYNVVIENNFCHDSSGNGIRFEETYNSKVEGNIVTRCAGIRIEDSSNNIIADNVVTESSGNGIVIYNRSKRNIVIGNQLIDNNTNNNNVTADTPPRDGNAGRSHSGIQLQYHCHNNIVTGNICYNSTGGIGHQKFGIAINNRNFYDTEASSYNIITNNTCVNNEVEQISDRGFFNDLSHNITYLYDE